jgi:catechol 2,3-dioxygenase-like lactoylglutathione lyase family enzyme
MAVELNHSIIWCSDKARSSAFMTGILGLPPARTFYHFLVVDLDNRVSLDFYQKEGPVAPEHYAFLVGEAEFDAAFARIEAQGLTYWADPARTKPGEINDHDGGRGIYFEDPDGHLLELITRPYGGWGG